MTGDVADRHLDWEGCFNARDLGGFRTIDGRRTRSGAVVRSDSLEGLTPAGWAAVKADGISTIVDLRNDDEIGSDHASRPRELTTVRVPMDDADDTQFWQWLWDNELDGSPLFYQPFLDRKPERCAAVVHAIAHASPGGVVFHCTRGRDRTGLVAMLLLSLVGVSADDIAIDYELSTERVRLIDAHLGEEDEGSIIEEIMSRKKTSSRSVLLGILESFDADAYLRSAGLTDDDVMAVRSRLLGPSRVPSRGVQHSETPGL